MFNARIADSNRTLVKSTYTQVQGEPKLENFETHDLMKFDDLVTDESTNIEYSPSHLKKVSDTFATNMSDRWDNADKGTPLACFTKLFSVDLVAFFMAMIHGRKPCDLEFIGDNANKCSIHEALELIKLCSFSNIRMRAYRNIKLGMIELLLKKKSNFNDFTKEDDLEIQKLAAFLGVKHELEQEFSEADAATLKEALAQGNQYDCLFTHLDYVKYDNLQLRRNMMAFKVELRKMRLFNENTKNGVTIPEAAIPKIKRPEIEIEEDFAKTTKIYEDAIATEKVERILSSILYYTVGIIVTHAEKVSKDPEYKEMHTTMELSELFGQGLEALNFIDNDRVTRKYLESYVTCFPVDLANNPKYGLEYADTVPEYFALHNIYAEAMKKAEAALGFEDE